MNLLAYIQGKRKGKDAYHIEREAMRDPFLADALDGFDAVEGDHAERIAGIRMRLSASGRKANREIVYISIAASLLLCVSIGSYFLMHKDERSFIAQSEMTAIEKNMAEEYFPEARAEKNKEVDDMSANLDRHVQDNSGIQRKKSSVADAVIAAEESEKQLSEIAAAEEPKFNEDSLMMAQAETIQSSKLTMPSEARQQAMTTSSTASGMPEPEIGMEAYKKYLKDSMIHPETGACAKKKGEVIVAFNINAEGRPHSIELRKKLCEDLDKEAIRLIEKGPSWVGDTSKSVIVEVKF